MTKPAILGSIGLLNLAYNEAAPTQDLNWFDRQIKDLFGSYIDYQGQGTLYLRYQQAARKIHEVLGHEGVKFRAKPSAYISPHLVNARSIERATLREAKAFRKFLVKNGQRFRKTYRYESPKRAITFEGTGEWEGFTFQFITRQTLHSALESDHKGHCRDFDLILIDCHIACFYKSYNLNGHKNIGWRFFLDHTPAKAKAMPWLKGSWPREDRA